MCNPLKNINLKKTEEIIRDFLRKEIGDRGVVFGLSGGVDSSTVAALLARTFEREKILALIMPERSDLEEIQDAMFIVNKYNLQYRIIEIEEIVKCFLNKLERKGDLIAEGNLKARVRMIILYYFANMERRIVVGCGDRSELAIGYFTKYGDGGVDILPIGGLYKTQVRLLAKFLNIPERIIEKESSPGLWRGQTAKEELGMSYDEIDEILYYHLDLGYDYEKIVKVLGEERRDKIKFILRRIIENRHKLINPPIAKIPNEVLFGE
ncbi:MAG: NAD+ synthase [Candidatus Methanomethyliaceae archaeon]|nr:NAD+ synthase [Candidatus Methanomethyliaceae archaeon]MDW7970847.1 NAD+ synthase [Nitrososphaerota archaeon]